MTYGIIGNGRVGKICEKGLIGNKKMFSIRKNECVDSILMELMKCEYIILGQKMRNEGNLGLLKYLIEKLCDLKYEGVLINPGSTTEFFPLPFKTEYGRIKKRSLEILTENINKKYRLIHIIIPGTAILNEKKFINQILVGMKFKEDFYSSCAFEIRLNGNTNEDYIQAALKFSYIPIYLSFIIKFLFVFYIIKLVDIIFFSNDYQLIVNYSNRVIIFYILGFLIDKIYLKYFCDVGVPYKIGKTEWVYTNIIDVNKSRDMYHEYGIGVIKGKLLKKNEKN